jgi:hypothetical protein
VCRAGVGFLIILFSDLNIKQQRLPVTQPFGRKNITDSLYILLPAGRRNLRLYISSVAQNNLFGVKIGDNGREFLRPAGNKI